VSQYRKTIVAVAGAIVVVLNTVLGTAVLPDSTVKYVSAAAAVITALLVYVAKNDPAPAP